MPTLSVLYDLMSLIAASSSLRPASPIPATSALSESEAGIGDASESVARIDDISPGPASSSLPPASLDQPPPPLDQPPLLLHQPPPVPATSAFSGSEAGTGEERGTGAASSESGDDSESEKGSDDDSESEGGSDNDSESVDRSEGDRVRPYSDPPPRSGRSIGPFIVTKYSEYLLTCYI